MATQGSQLLPLKQQLFPKQQQPSTAAEKMLESRKQNSEGKSGLLIYATPTVADPEQQTVWT